MRLKGTGLYEFYAVLFIAVISLGISCKTTEQIHIEENTAIISIGSFGGFAGTFKEYRICSDGLLFIKTKPNGAEKQLSKLDEKTITQFTSVLKVLSEDMTTIYNPGNMTYFIKYHKGDQETVEWVWGGGEKANSQIQSIYRILSKLCKTQEHPIR